MTQAVMSSEAKKALSKTIRALRERLLTDLHEATEGAYLLGVPIEKAKLTEAARIKRQRLEAWIAEQARSASNSTAKKGRTKAERDETARRFRRQMEQDAAATWLTRLVYLRVLEASDLCAVKLVTGGWESPAYKELREHAPELVQDDPTEGYAALLQLAFDELALELPGVFGDVRMTSLVPMPPATLRALLDALNDSALDEAWLDDTTLGWVYQYWNDPEREALDAKLNANQKLENHELASKTQMFTERYMVEWLLHNTLGTQWLALCKRNGWTADVEQKGDDGLSTLERLEARRVAWRARREAGEVALDALMPIASGAGEAGLEARWKYWVPQPIKPISNTDSDTGSDSDSNPLRSVRELKLLDPACGSGHFLVIAFELLCELHQEEERHRAQDAQANGGTFRHRGRAEIASDVLEHNLYGIDIDPRAVQIAAAALRLKHLQLARELAHAQRDLPGTLFTPHDLHGPRVLNLVAPSLSLAALPKDDPALLELVARVEREIGLPRALTERVLQALAGADHLGTLLQVDTAIDAALAEWEMRLTRKGKPQQGKLGFGDTQSFEEQQLEILSLAEARETLVERLEEFLAAHSSHEDLGLRLRGEQLASGVRFMRMVRQDQYDLVIGNPPYQGTTDLVDASYVQKHYPRGKADLYAAFLERGLQLAHPGGISALLTKRNWMFSRQFSELRQWLLRTYDLRVLCDADRGAFEEVPDEIVAVAMSVFCRAQSRATVSIVIQPTPLDDRSRDSERTSRKRAALLCHVGRFEVCPADYAAVELHPFIYWWRQSDLDWYASLPLLGRSAPAKFGLNLGSNIRFTRRRWEIAPGDCFDSRANRELSGVPSDFPWVRYLMGATGVRWFDPIDIVCRWMHCALELKASVQHRYGTISRKIVNEGVFFKAGIGFVMIGSEFGARAHWWRCVIDGKGSSLYPTRVDETLCFMNSARAKAVLSSLNPGLDFTVGDVNRLPVFEISESPGIVHFLRGAFTLHESHREPSVEYKGPGPSPWRYAQEWAQLAVDRAEGAPLPAYEPVLDPEPPTDHLSFALGVALGRFGAPGAAAEGVLSSAPASALPHGILFLSAAREHEPLGLQHPACALLHAVWSEHAAQIDSKRDLNAYLREKFFAEVHRQMYEKRPIYFPLSSAEKTFVAYVSIHRWDERTLRTLLAEHLHPLARALADEKNALLATRQSSDKKAARAAEQSYAETSSQLDELKAFVASVEQCAEKGPPATDANCPERKADARYAPDLDDGVMINAAALWPLLEPQWRDPKRWWKELASAVGKKDYDWSHLAARYFPERVEAKCKIDPSLAVAHHCFWKHHPERAYAWELRLQHEIAPDFRLDEPDSDALRAQLERDKPQVVAELIAAETKRRDRKSKSQLEMPVELDAEDAEDEEPET